MAKVDGIRCPMCKAEIWSRATHHCCSCPCGYAFIDGGRSYTRVGYGGPDWPEPWPVPESIEIEVEDAPVGR